MSRYTNICFTWNNPPTRDGTVVPPTYNEEAMHYMVYQYEQGENGTYHWQGYCELKNARSLRQIKTLVGCQSLHVEKRRGTAQQASDYCKKEDSRVPGGVFYEHGEMKATNQGQRNDINDFRDDILGGKRKRELLDDHALMLAKYPKFYQMVKGLVPPERENNLKVYLLIGPPGCGKTRSVHEAYGGPKRGELFRAPLSNGTMWFDGFDGQQAVLFDDFNGAASKVTLVNFLQIIDRYPIQVPVKGEFTWWSPDKIYITTNIYPREWYKWENRVIHYQALARRFHAVFDFYETVGGYGDPPVGGNDLLPYMHEDYIDHGISLQGCTAPPRYEGKEWWIKERPDDAVPW